MVKTDSAPPRVCEAAGWPGSRAQAGNPPEPPVAALAREAIRRGLDALAAGPSADNPPPSALRWLERAHRLVPLDPNATLTLASACLAHDPPRAASLFQTIADLHDVRLAWLGLAAARLRLNGPEDAAQPLAVVLSRHAFAPDVTALAEAIGGRQGCPGWCALRSDGRLEINATSLAKGHTKPAPTDGVRIFLDGKPLRGTTLPAGWPLGHTIDVRIGNTPLLGSPIQLTAIRRITGCVEIWDGGIRGWAWHPGDPATPPALTLLDPTGRPARHFQALDESVAVADTGPLARPRTFRFTTAELPLAPGPMRVTGPNGKDLLGSPLDPSFNRAAYSAAIDRPQDPRPPPIAARNTGSVPRADAPVPTRPLDANGQSRATTIVIPVHDGGPIVLACLHSVLASVPPRSQVRIVDDGSSDPTLMAVLDDLARQRRITLLRHATAQGFPAAVNAAIRGIPEDDIVLLDSDTLVPPGWLERLRQAAYASRDIGTVTPFSNDAGILSYPGPAGTNPRPDQATTTRFDQAARRANGGALADIPASAGVCLYLRRDCINAVGAFQANLFAQGYGEQTDFCLRARQLGWRNVALTGLFVGHHGGASFGAGAGHLRARNARVLEQRHPGYHALIEHHLAHDPLAPPRRRVDLHRWRQRGREWRQSAILITHDEGGGVEQRLIHAIALHQQAGRRPIVLRPSETASGEPAILVRDSLTDDCPNMVYAMPRELPALLRLLRAARPERIEIHHCADHPPAIYDLVRRLRTPYDVHVHDYAWFCPRISLVGANDRYCGEPDLPGCETCIADNGRFLKDPIGVAALRHRSTKFLAAARRVIVPSDDTGARMRRHFEGLTTSTVPHEDDAALPPMPPPQPIRSRLPERPRTRICVVGGIGVHKGYDILLACARDAVRRDLDLEFIVVGHTIDDAPLLATGQIFVTGRFEPQEVVNLIAAQNARLGFVASICPETWCLSLGDIWRAGLRAAAFDIGAPAERIRNTGRGILLPLGLSSSAINNILVAAAGTAAHE